MLVERYLGHKAERIEQLGGGHTNFVFEVDSRSGQYILRMSNKAHRLQDFLKEEWAISRAREEGVPTAEILKVAAEPPGTPLYDPPPRARDSREFGGRFSGDPP